MLTKKDAVNIASFVKYIADDPTADHSTVLKIVQELGNAATAMNPKINREEIVAAVFGESHKVHNSWDYSQFIECKACGYDKFYDRGRSLDTFNHECGRCGHMSHTLTETGMSA